MEDASAYPANHPLDGCSGSIRGRGDLFLKGAAKRTFALATKRARRSPLAASRSRGVRGARIVSVRHVIGIRRVRADNAPAAIVGAVRAGESGSDGNPVRDRPRIEIRE
jgi:hypothetical protein